jgi:hypothetical protein
MIGQFHAIADELHCAQTLMERVGSDDSVGRSAAWNIREAFRVLASLADSRRDLYVENMRKAERGESVSMVDYSEKMATFRDMEVSIRGVLTSGVQLVPLVSMLEDPKTRTASLLAMRKNEADSLRTLFGKIAMKPNAKPEDTTIYQGVAFVINRWLNQAWTSYLP